MNIYKDFIYNIRKMEFETPYLIVTQKYPPTYLYGYVKSLLAIPFMESCYNVYYGEIRTVVYSFLNFFTICTGQTYKKGEDYKNTLQYSTMMQLFKKTVLYHESSHEKFLKEFQPIESAEEQEKFDTIISQYNIFMEELLKFGNQLKALDKQDKIDNFARDHFSICAEKIHQICDYTHLFIAIWLEKHTREIRVSLEDILHRIRTNYTAYKKDYEDRLNELYNELYELNKENVYISRQENHNPQEAAANKKNRAIIRNKIQSLGNFYIFKRLNEEVEYWSRRLAEYEEITTIINNIKTPLEKTKAEERIHSRFETIEIPESDKSKCWHRMKENFVNYREDLEKKYLIACRPLVTFFSCRGVDRILYVDSIGSYYIDEYDHQNYITHYGAKFYHVNCMGQYKENAENEKYYFDKNGRYILQDGKKVYQLAPCTSHINLTENGLWRNTEPCECMDPTCFAKSSFGTCIVQIQDLTDVVLLPKSENNNIERTLDSDSVKYLWDSYGWILPEILNDVAKAMPKNPIHYLAHLLLNKSHSSSDKDIRTWKKEATKYRDDIIEKRKKDAEARARAWKLKQVKPCKTMDCGPSYISKAYKSVEDSQQLSTDLSMYYTL